MNDELFADTYYNAHRIPVCVFSGKTLKCSGNHTVQDYNLPLYLIASLPDKLPFLWYAVTPEQLYFGGILLPDSGDVLMLGPVLSRVCSRTQAARIISRLGRGEADIPVLMRGLNTFRQTDLSQLKAMLSLLALHFYDSAGPKPVSLAFSWADIFPSPAVEIHDLPDTEYEIAEEPLLACVEYGKPDELRQLLSETVYQAGPEHTPTLDLSVKRQYLAGANMLCSRRAASGGLPLELANELADFYLDQIAAAESGSELDHLFYRLITDYAGQVQRMNLASFQTPVASRVHRYIYAHIHEKLSTGKIADDLHLSETHLCRSFKRETNTTIVDHVQKCKITEARYLLSSGQYTASQVSDLLCFSSQSYFTSVFRRHTGLTPVQYQKDRKNNGGQTSPDMLMFTADIALREPAYREKRLLQNV